MSKAVFDTRCSKRIFLISLKTCQCVNKVKMRISISECPDCYFDCRMFKCYGLNSIVNFANNKINSKG